MSFASLGIANMQNALQAVMKFKDEHVNLLFVISFGFVTVSSTKSAM